MMMLDNKMTTMDFHRSTNEVITGKSGSMRSQRIDTNPRDSNNTDREKKSSNNYSPTSVEDTNNMFTKVSLSM
jgi:hypothetical protein